MSDYKKIRAILKGDPEIAAGMVEAIDYYEKLFPHPAWAKLRQFDFSADVEGLTQWFTESLTSDPPDPRINGFFFAVSDGLTLYLQGTAQMAEYGTDGFDWAYDGPLNYSKDYVPSEFFSLLQEAGETPEARGFHGDYDVALMFTALLVTHLCRTVPLSLLLGKAPYRGIIVGIEEDETSGLAICALTPKGVGRFRKPTAKDQAAIPAQPPSDFYALRPPLKSKSYPFVCARPDKRPPTRYHLDKVSWERRGNIPDFCFVVDGGFVVSSRAAKFFSEISGAKIQLYPCTVGEPRPLSELLRPKLADAGGTGPELLPGEYYFFKPGVIVDNFPASLDNAPAPLFRTIEKGFFRLAIITADLKRQIEQAGITGLEFEPVGKTGP